jgi:hypothetical protein
VPTLQYFRPNIKVPDNKCLEGIINRRHNPYLNPIRIGIGLGHERQDSLSRFSSEKRGADVNAEGIVGPSCKFVEEIVPSPFQYP